ncbi:Tim44 domain-containing protein [Rhodoferax aquaticus]|uniref:Tim44 domain-containing protein n=1 Tax=Rhodoferax aquaticus TaxID=2527691 RepID=A0A515ES21_9BURK|nr:Tim44-like domain-containing protein [Rhodoferax aquaticus]QDL55466.1 Tim44 domain-containing protein [Rhodoferax aquaticus]
MNKVFLILAMLFAFGLSSVVTEAEAAKRVGSGKSMGTQRQATQDKAPAATNQAGAAAPAAAAPSRSSWMGPVAGLAAGLGLAALASHFGFGDELASMVMMGLLAAAIMVAVGFFLRKRAAAKQGNGAAPAGMQYATIGGSAPQGANVDHNTPAYKVSMPAQSNGSVIGSAIGSGLAASTAAAKPLPAGFDSAAFERNAKVNFIRLQAANDAGNLDDIRQFTSPEMFAELKMDLAERGTATQKTEVVSINANVIEVDEDADRYLVSVRFTGVIRDHSGEPDENFNEIWHMTKPITGNHGWVLAGIQQA